MLIGLDRQLATQRCEACSVDIPVVRGSVYGDGEPFGLYLVALHGHGASGRIAHMAIAILNPDSTQPLAAAMQAIATPEQLGFSVTDWNLSPWIGESYLGQLLSRDELLAHPKKAVFFHIGERLLTDLIEVKDYLDGPSPLRG